MPKNVRGDLTVEGSVFGKAPQEYFMSINGAKVGSAAGWTLAAANDLYLATIAASQSAAKLVIGIRIPLKIGQKIIGFKLVGELVSAGNAVTFDCDLRKGTSAAGSVTDASIATMTQLSATASAIITAGKTGFSAVITAGCNYYFVITTTTGVSCSAILQGLTVTVQD